MNNGCTHIKAPLHLPLVPDLSDEEILGNGLQSTVYFVFDVRVTVRGGSGGLILPCFVFEVFLSVRPERVASTNVHLALHTASSCQFNVHKRKTKRREKEIVN